MNFFDLNIVLDDDKKMFLILLKKINHCLQVTKKINQKLSSIHTIKILGIYFIRNLILLLENFKGFCAYYKNAKQITLYIHTFNVFM